MAAVFFLVASLRWFRTTFMDSREIASLIGDDSVDRNASMPWVSTSSPVFTTTDSGMEYVKTGSTIESMGKIFGCT